MTDPLPEDVLSADESLIVAAAVGVPSEIAFVVPASAYDSIATDDELSRPLEPPRIELPAPIDLSPALRAIEAVGEKIAALQNVFEREVRAESTREKVVDRLHAELQEYKQGLLLSVMRPVFVDLIQLHDDVGKMLAPFTGENHEPIDPSRVRSLFEGIQQGIEDVLYRQGVEPFTHDGDAFDARRQRAVITVPTADPAQARTVASRDRKGFTTADKVIRPEIVSVYLLKKTENPAG